MIRLNCGTIATSGRCLLALIALIAFQRNLPATPMVYTGIVVTDVRVGTTLMHNASLKITFQGDTENIVQVPGSSSTECNGPGYFFYLAKGVARMEIEYRGRTRTARLNDGQIFVDLDECNGGIGFGAFTGPKGMEVAYPFALTMGTGEYVAVTFADPFGAPLKSASSTTGAAWSCIGYPPGYFNQQTPGTATGNCISPDSYPLKSDIGNIFIYQPYDEYGQSGSTALSSNHSGSTNRGSFLVRQQERADFATMGAPATGPGPRVVYTLQTVTDGSLGGHVFHQALVTLQMVSSPHSVTSHPSAADPTKPVYENRSGVATVTVDDGGNVTVAEFAPEEVYVRYDTGTGVAGFGSKISPTYPIALNCSDSAYPSESSYTVDCLQGEAWNYLNFDYPDDIFHSGTLAQLSYPGLPSPGVQALPQSLSQNTLLTGPVHSCAGIYTFFSANSSPYLPGDLGKCQDPAPRGLHTSKGALYLQDLEGGTLTLGNAIIVGDEGGSGGGWALANSGFLHVEVYGTDN